MFDFSKVKGIEALDPQLRRKFESTATQHMNCIENPKTRKKYEPVKVIWDRANKRFDVYTRGVGKFYYKLNGEWY